MQANVDSTVKVLKFFFAISILVWFGMTLLMEQVTLMDTEGGFVYQPQDETAQLLLYIFAGVSLMNLVLQFIVPNWIRARVNSPAGNLNASVIRYAFCESIAVLGFLLFLLNGQIVESWIFMGVAMLALLFGDRQPTKAL